MSQLNASDRHATASNHDEEHDEIDLRELIRTVIKQKKIIIGVALATLSGSLLYAFLTPSIYKAQISYLPPTQADIAELVTPGVAETTVTPESIYQLFEKNLNAVDSRREIFTKIALPAIYGAETSDPQEINNYFLQFNKNFTIEKPKFKKDEFTPPIITLSLTGKNPELLATILKDLDKTLTDKTKREAIDGILKSSNVKKEVLKKDVELLREKTQKQVNDQIVQLEETDGVERKKLEDQISTLRTNAKTKRMDKIQELTEAAKVAESVGLIEKSSLLESSPAPANSNRGAIYTEVNTQAPPPLYLRGSKALRAEIKELNERVSDDPFIPGLRDLQDKLELLKTNRQVEALLARKTQDPFIKELRDKESELALLESFKIDPVQVKVATVDQFPIPPKQREQPKRAMIIALGGVAGLFLGIMAAFMNNFWQNFRREEDSQA